MRRTTVRLWVLGFGLFLAQQVLVLALSQSEPTAQPKALSELTKVINSSFPFLETGILAQMNILVTTGTQADQIVLGVVSQPAS